MNYAFLAYIFFFIFCFDINAQSNQGILHSLDNLIFKDKQKISFYASNSSFPVVVSKESDLDIKKYSYELNIDYLNSLFFNSSNTLNNTIKSNLCTLYELLYLNVYQHKVFNNNLLANQINKRTKQARIIKGSKTVILNHLINKNCPQSKANITLAKNNNSRILKNYSFNELLQSSRCEQKISTLIKSQNFSYLAYLSKRAKAKPSLFKSLSQQELNGLKLFNEYLQSNSKICSVHTGENLLSISQDQLTRKNYITPLCKDYFKTKRSLKENEILKCVNSIRDNLDFCYTHKSRYNNAFFPLQDCKVIGENFILNKYKNLTSDCPGKIANEGIVNAARVISTLSNTKEINHCFSKKIEKLVEFSSKAGIEDVWDVKLCYLNKFYNDKRCYKTLFDKVDGPLSYKSIIEKILKDSKIISSNISCMTTKYKVLKIGESTSGCAIQIDPTICSLNSCPFVIYINGNKIKHDIALESKINLSYFPKTNRDISNSFQSLLKSQYKMNSSPVKNMTQLRKFIKKKRSIIHGVGCAEELLSNFYFRKSFASCRPVPFLISGIKTDKRGYNNALVNLSIDNMINTREIAWNDISSSISSYSKHFGQWSLYAIYKD